MLVLISTFYPLLWLNFILQTKKITHYKEYYFKKEKNLGSGERYLNGFVCVHVWLCIHSHALNANP